MSALANSRRRKVLLPYLLAHDLGSPWVRLEDFLKLCDLLRQRVAACWRLIEIGHDHVDETARKPFERGIDLFREDALDGQIFHVVERRRFGVAEGVVAESELRALNIEVFVKRREGHRSNLKGR